MRAAPPVSVRGNGGAAWRAVQTLLPALAAAALTFWGSSLMEATATAISTTRLAALATVAGLIVGVLAWRLLGRSPSQLSWGGQHWTLERASGAQAAAVQGQLEVMVDLGAFMLLRLLPATGPRRWMAITAREAGVHWHGLRAAAHARAPSQAADPDQARGSSADLHHAEAAR